ncbi:lysyl oxidase homolog 3A-like isoform X1 [Asterias rubens]|uniref:lysyl oxidase homolog 3A-like isoform X1 n=2 Tax=Asterias rubens TaxID=7604 RepID=UPI0014555004|nr:lysyl oxidase homolog 3A-like isoform X1 [Asterias rubens]
MMILHAILITFATIGLAMAADGDLVLFGGSDENSGMVLIEFGGKQGKVCNYDWDVYAADVVCKQTRGTTSKSTGYFAPPKWKGLGVFLDGVQCQGNEESLMDCVHEKLGQSSCPAERSAGVICWSPEEYLDNKVEGSVRLVDGKTSQDGRVEVFLASSWGPVCDERWGAFDADTVCKQLGCTNSKGATTGSAYGEGSLDFKLNEVLCAASNVRLVDCPYSFVDNTTSCNHTMEAGAVCNCSIEITVGENNSGSGLVKVSSSGASESTICYDGFGPRTADVVCREAGHKEALSISSVKRTASSLSNISYSCLGSEMSLVTCPTAPFNVSDCTEGREAAVVCQTNDEPVPTAEPTPGPLGLSTGAIVGIVIGVLAGVLVLVVLCCAICRGRRGGPASI